jgi:hypothetical protein
MSAVVESPSWANVVRSRLYDASGDGAAPCTSDMWSRAHDGTSSRARFEDAAAAPIASAESDHPLPHAASDSCWCTRTMCCTRSEAGTLCRAAKGQSTKPSGTVAAIVCTASQPTIHQRLETSRAVSNSSRQIEFEEQVARLQH